MKSDVIFHWTIIHCKNIVFAKFVLHIEKISWNFWKIDLMKFLYNTISRGRFFFVG